MQLTIFSEDQFENLIRKIDEIKLVLDQQNVDTNTEIWLTSKQAAKVLQKTTRTLQSYRDQGMIPFSQHGREIRYRQSDIQDYLFDHYIEGRRAG